MRSVVFVDTVAWLAIVNKSDELHHTALQVKKILIENKATLTTTDFVVIETANSLSRLPMRRLATELIEFIMYSGLVGLVRANHDLIEQAWSLYKSRNDKEWSLTDCISFVVMKQNKITDAFTNNHHFEQSGFNILIK